MKIVKSIPEPKRSRNATDKRKKEVVEFLATGAKYGLVEHRSIKSANSEACAYREAAKQLGCDNLVKFYTRNEQVFVERVDS